MDLLNMLSGVLGSQENVSKLSQQIGAEPEKTSNALSAALPLILGALARNAKKEEGAQSLANALDRDHDGSILNDVGGFMNNSEQGPGQGILGHVFGEKRPVAENAVADKAGLDVGQVAKMMVTVAPLVMGFLGKQKRENNLGPQELGSALGVSAQEAEKQNPELGFLGKLLDRDGDGNVMDDVMGMLGGMFGGKK